MSVQFISYTGKYPNLCRGICTIIVNNKQWEITDLCSGGRVSFDEDWTEHVEEGPWSVEWPEGFPEEYKIEALAVINSNIGYGCCGGCI